MRDVQVDVTRHQSRINVEWAYVDKNFTDIEQSLVGLSCRMNVVEEITESWNCLQGELNAINEDIASI